MQRKLLNSVVALVAVLAVWVVTGPAEARRGGGHGHAHVRMGGSHHFAVPRVRSARVFYHRRAHFRRFHRRVFIGGLYTYRHRRCAWLRHRAIVTGSSYWWRRYWRCRHAYRYY